MWSPLHKDARRILIPALMLTLFSQLPFLSPTVLPFHDTMQNYQFFHFFYNGIRFDHALPLWIPYGNYGIGADSILWSALPPASWLMMPFGALLGIDDTMLLFKIGIILEVLLFIFGMVLLAQTLFDGFLARWVVLSGAIFSLNWMGQMFLMLQVIYLMPLILYALVRFQREESTHWFWTASLLGLLSLPGNLP